MKTLNSFKSCSLFAFSLIVSLFLFSYASTLRAEDTVAQPETAQPAAAEASFVAQVVWVKGTVKAIGADQKERVLKRRDSIFEKDTLVTDKDSTGQIVFTDNSLVALNKATQFKVDQYKYSAKNPSGDKYIVSLAKGGFRSITGAIGKSNPDNYKVNTPVATIGVRGTEFVVALDKSGHIYTKIEVGSISVKTTVGAVVLTAGTDKTYAKIESLSQAPKVVTAAQVPVSIAQTPRILPATTAPVTTQPASVTTTPAIAPASTPSSTTVVPTEAPVAPVAPVDAPKGGFCIS